MQSTKKSVSVSELKTHLSECLRSVKHGEQWVVTERGKPIAVLGPSPDVDQDLVGLAAAGAVRLGTGSVPTELWDLPHPEDDEGSVRAAVVEERSQGW